MSDGEGGMKISAVAMAVLSCVVGVPASSAEFPKSGFLSARGLTENDFPRWKAIEPNTYIYEDTHSPDPAGEVLGTVSMIVVTSDGVVLVDGQEDAKDGKRLVDTIKKLSPLPLRYVVVASDHIDHVGGNPEIKAAYPGAIFISSPASQKTMAKREVVPTETVSDKRVLKVGDTELHILNLGRAHTGGDLAVYLPQNKVLFLGEIYMRDIFPSHRSSYPSEWAATVKKAQTIDASWVIPGHGFVDGNAEMKRDLDESRKVLEYIVTEGKRLHAAGLPCASADKCEAAKQVNWGPYAKLGGVAHKTGMAIERVYMEIEGKLPK